MSTSFSNIKFKSSDVIFSKIKRFLKSYDFAGIIDEGEFPTYTKEVLNKLGIGVYREQRAILNIKDGKACLPKNFKFYSNAFKCEVDEYTWRDKQDTAHLQSSMSFERDVTQEFFLDYDNCAISYYANGRSVIESVNIKSTVYTKADATFNRIIPLNLAKHVDKDLLASEDIVINVKSRDYEVSLDGTALYTNFTEGVVYLEYFGFPLDDNGGIEIPEIEHVEKAIEWYIIYQILLSSWFNSTVPDIQNKFIKAEQEYEKSFAEAKYYLKAPSFQTLINAIRTKRSTNSLAFFTSNYLGTNYQRNN